MNRDLAAIVDRARDDAVPAEQRYAAFTELVKRFEEAALGWSLQLLDDPEEAKDATQDAFLAAWVKLPQLRDSAAFGAWLRRLIATQCRRRRRKRHASAMAGEQEVRAASECVPGRPESQQLLTKAMSRLSETDRRVLMLHYFAGRNLDEIATLLTTPRGTIGKRLHLARIAIRRNLPRRVREQYVQMRPTSQFQRKVREGLFDEYLGHYRFEERPELIVRIEREGAFLVGYGGDQRNVLTAGRDGTLIATVFDGEGRFQRDDTGRVVQFVYYEFGERLGIAKKIQAAAQV